MASSAIRGAGLVSPAQPASRSSRSVRAVGRMPGIFRSLRADAAGAPHPGPGHEPPLRRKSFFTPAQSATGMANTRNQSFLAKISAAAAMPASQPLLAYFTPMAEIGRAHV